MRPSCFILLFLLSVPATCLSWPAKVVSISDGDTITVLHSGAEERIRLYGIDCPEKNQDYGQQAKSITGSLITGRQVDVQTITADQYGRTVALVSVDGQSLNELIIRNGYAWVYPQYCKKQFCSDWLRLEANARQLKKGLWAGSNIVKPWDFRKYAQASRKETPATPRTLPKEGNSSGFRCDGRTYCSQMTSCAEATWFIQNCPGTKMDGDNDGVPCEKQWCR
nr:thermonuclease family protein [uncultured Desulfobulbus sp.]